MRAGDIVPFRGHHVHTGVLSSKSVVVDLGGHKGEFADEIVRRTGCVCHSVEAVPRLYESIPSGPQRFKYHYAIAGHDGTVELSLGTNPEANSIRGVAREQDAGVVSVPAITLSSFLDKHVRSPVDLVKLDIEGAEVDVFESTSDAVLSAIPQWTVEFHDFLPHLGLTKKVDDIVRRMHDLRFHSVVFSRYKRLDTLFISRDLCSYSDYLYMRYVVRNLRGVERVMRRWGLLTH